MTEPTSSTDHTDGPPSDDAPVVATLDLVVAGQKMHVEIPIAPGPVTGAALVPLARALLAAISERMVEVLAGSGRQVSCRAGCGACCRQLAPVSPAEARALHALVAALPEPRRSEIRGRFAAIQAALGQAGLLDQISDTRTVAPGTQRELGQRYFDLWLACPFLDAESCSIHPDRPLVCREHLVTSPATFCADFASDDIKSVPTPAAITTAMLACDPEAASAPWVALSAALDWVDAHPAPAPQVAGPDLLRRFLSQVFQRKIPASGISMLDSAG
jgi:Fe-S-cluster containining protein